VGAGLLVRTLQNLQATNLGLRTEGLLVFGLSPKAVVHSADEARRFTRNLLARMRSLPGIESATVMDNRIGSGWSNNTGMFKVDGVPAGPDAHLRWTHAGPDYFQVLGTPLVMGRDLRDSDSETAPKVIIVNETFARKYLAGSQPLGHTVGIGQGLAFSIVGVVKDSKFTEVSEEIRPTAYVPYFQSQIGIFNTLQVEVRTMGDPLLHLAEIRRAVAGLGPDLALMQPMTQRAQFDLSFAQERLFGRFAMFFGLLAVLLVGTGLYGTLAFAVTRRTAEVGVRMALGAQRGQVLWMVMRGSLVVCAGSVVVGLPAAIAAARFLRSMLFGVTPGDALTYGVAISGILAVALIASLIPARRAASVDPMVALRQE
jgi:predicted permease